MCSSDLTGALLLVGGLWLTLCLLMASPLWLWELNESWPVRPVASMVRQQPLQRPGGLWLWQEGERPSLSWYAGRRIDAASGASDLPASPDGVLLLSRSSPSPGHWRCQRIGKAAPMGLFSCQP